MGITKQMQLEEMERDAQEAALELLSDEDYQQVLSIDAAAKRRRASKSAGVYVRMDKLIDALDELASPTDRMTVANLAHSMDWLLRSVVGRQYDCDDDDPMDEEFDRDEYCIDQMQRAFREWYAGARRQHIEAIIEYQDRCQNHNKTR